jgi:transcription antitermination factor NusG
MNASQAAVRWFALRVKSRHEKAVAAAVRGKGFEEFLPLYRWRHVWSDRTKWVEMPLFPGYVFCKLDPEFRLPLLTIPGALDFVAFGRTPAPIADGEMESVQAAVRSKLNFEPCSFLDGGDRVRLDQGPAGAIGMEGIVTKVEAEHRMIISVTVLKRSMSVQIEPSWVEPLAARTVVSGQGD